MLSRFNIIVSTDINGGIAKDGGVPWSSMADGIFFRDTTIGRRKNAVIMGRTTYEKIPMRNRPLQERHVYVISRSWKQEDHQEVTICRSLLDALINTSSKVYNYDEVFVAGGEMIYNTVLRSYMHLCDKIYWTKFKMNYDCDQHFDTDQIKDFPYFQEPQLTQDYSRYYILPGIVHPETKYLNFVKVIIEHGETKKSGGILSKELFGYSIAFDVSDGKIPVLTTKLIDYPEIIKELVFELSGDTFHPEQKSILESSTQVLDVEQISEPLSDIVHAIPAASSSNSTPISRFSGLPRFATDQHIQKKGFDDVYEKGEYGPYFAFQLKHWNSGDYTTGDETYGGEDQYDYIIQNINTTPSSRKHVAIGWNLSYYAQQLQHPRVLSLQFNTSGDGKFLDISVSLRKTNAFSELPQLIVKYSIMLAMFAHISNLSPRKVCFQIGHAYIHDCDTSNVSKQISRTPRPFPMLSFRRAAKHKSISDFAVDSVLIEGYNSWPAINPKIPR